MLENIIEGAKKYISKVPEIVSPLAKKALDETIYYLSKVPPTVLPLAKKALQGTKEYISKVHEIVSPLAKKAKEKTKQYLAYLKSRVPLPPIKKKWIYSAIVLALGISIAANEVQCWRNGEPEEKIAHLEKRLKQHEKKPTGFEDSYFIVYAKDISGHDWKSYIRSSDYLKYKTMPHTRSSGKELVDFVMWRDPNIRKIAKNLTSKCSSKEEAANNLLKFAQQFVYDTFSEYKNKDYVRYPIETLVEGNGDCEDAAILAAALMKSIGIDVVLLDFPDHIAVGVNGNFKGSYWESKGRRYYYAEATGQRWKKKEPNYWAVGTVPDKFKRASAHIHHIK